MHLTRRRIADPNLCAMTAAAAALQDLKWSLGEAAFHSDLNLHFILLLLIRAEVFKGHSYPQCQGASFIRGYIPLWHKEYSLVETENLDEGLTTRHALERRHIIRYGLLNSGGGGAVVW